MIQIGNAAKELILNKWKCRGILGAQMTNGWYIEDICTKTVTKGGKKYPVTLTWYPVDCFRDQPNDVINGITVCRKVLSCKKKKIFFVYKCFNK